MTPDRIINTPIDHKKREEKGAVPVGEWTRYGSDPDNAFIRAALKLRGLGTLYDTYQYLPLHVKEVLNSVSYARERVNENPESVMIAGCGQNDIELTTLYKAFTPEKIIAADISLKFLDTLVKRVKKTDTNTFSVTYPVLMDIGSLWPNEIADGDGRVLKMDSFDLIFCNIVFNWLTKDEQKQLFENVNRTLSVNGDFILASLTDKWNSNEVKKHIPEQMRLNPLMTLLGAVGSRRWADRVAVTYGINRPSIEQIYELADNTGLEVSDLDGDRIFWRNSGGDPCAVVCHIKRK